MNWIRLKKLLVRINLIMICGIWYGCVPKCSEEQLEILTAARDGDLEEIRGYLESGGDPLMGCNMYSGKGIRLNFFTAGYRLSMSVAASGSSELLEYYLSKEIPNTEKEEMLKLTVFDQDTAMTRLLLENGAFQDVLAQECFLYEAVNSYQVLLASGYEMDKPSVQFKHNTALMLYSRCPTDDQEDELIAILQFLLDHGARTDITNSDDNTAYDLAVNHKVKEFLKQYE